MTQTTEADSTASTAPGTAQVPERPRRDVLGVLGNHDVVVLEVIHLDLRGDAHRPSGESEPVEHGVVQVTVETHLTAEGVDLLREVDRLAARLPGLTLDADGAGPAVREEFGEPRPGVDPRSSTLEHPVIGVDATVGERHHRAVR